MSPKQATPFLCPACKDDYHLVTYGTGAVQASPVCQCSFKDCECFQAQVRAGLRTERGGWVR